MRSRELEAAANMLRAAEDERIFEILDGLGRHAVDVSESDPTCRNCGCRTDGSEAPACPYWDVLWVMEG